MTGLMGSQGSGITQATPSPKPPAEMPDPDSPAAREARRKAQADVLSRAGRTSTILTAPEKRSGDTYSSTRLGTAA